MRLLNGEGHINLLQCTRCCEHELVLRLRMMEACTINVKGRQNVMKCGMVQLDHHLCHGNLTYERAMYGQLIRGT